MAVVVELRLAVGGTLPLPVTLELQMSRNKVDLGLPLPCSAPTFLASLSPRAPLPPPSGAIPLSPPWYSSSASPCLLRIRRHFARSAPSGAGSSGVGTGSGPSGHHPRCPFGLTRSGPWSRRMQRRRGRPPRATSYSRARGALRRSAGARRRRAWRRRGRPPRLALERGSVLSEPACCAARVEAHPKGSPRASLARSRPWARLHWRPEWARFSTVL